MTRVYPTRNIKNLYPQCQQVEAWQHTLCGRGLQTPPALAVPLLQGDVQSGRGEGVAALLRLDQVPEAQDKEMWTGQIKRQKGVT